MNESSKPLVVAKHLTKIFGEQPDRAAPLVEDGAAKHEIFERTGQTVAVRDASFEVQEGEIFVVMGLSGCGKSTLLRMLNRLIEPTSGTVFLGDQEITAMSHRELIELRRGSMAMVFQSFALMPHLRVWENAAFGLEVAGVGRKERRKLATNALEHVGLGANAASYPDELSGGMQQRVGLARALAASPKILLMDEAFSALDPLIRSEMQEELIKLHRDQKLTVVFISHDLDEAMKIGNRIAIMDAGRVIQTGTPEEILQNPANDYVRSFFEGVDVSHVYTAGDLAAAHPATVTLDRDDWQSVLDRVRQTDHRYAYIQDRHNKLLGVASVDAIRQCAESKAKSPRLEYETVEPLQKDMSFDEVITRVARSKFPLPVVDTEGRLVGVIGKTALLKTLDTGRPAQWS